MIRLLLADDENLIRTALATLLSLEDDLTVVAQAASAGEALAMARHHRPDVAVLDLQMPSLATGALGADPGTEHYVGLIRPGDAYYRVTVRVEGPRSTVTYAQAVLK